MSRAKHRLPILIAILTAEDLRGERQDRPQAFGSVRRLLVREEGMVSLATLVAVLFLLVLIALTMNVAFTVKRKIQSQNTADAVAYSSGIWMARGLNAITAANHLTGELTALAVLHEAIGGNEELNQDAYTFEMMQKSAELFDSTKSAQKEGAQAGGFPQAGWTVVAGLPSSKGGAMLYDARSLLVDRIKQNNKLFEIAGALVETGYASAAGIILAQVATLIDKYLQFEFEFLEEIQQIAARLEFVKTTALQLIERIQGPYGYVDNLLRTTPKFITDTVESLATGNGLDRGATAIYPKTCNLPVAPQSVKESHQGSSYRWPYPKSGSPFDLGSYDIPNYGNPSRDKLNDLNAQQGMQYTQWVRSTYPWIEYWRDPITRFLSLLVFSRGDEFYRGWTDNYAVALPLRLSKSNSRLVMYVLPQGSSSNDLSANNKPWDKGSETWRKDADAADELFTVVGTAQHSEPSLAAPTLFAEKQEKGIVSYAQAIVYNSQNKERASSKDRQPILAWDTLNWIVDSKSPVHEVPAESKVQTFPNPLAAFNAMFTPLKKAPQINFVWQAKLIPVSRLDRAADVFPDKFARPLKRIKPVPLTFKTH